MNVPKMTPSRLRVLRAFDKITFYSGSFLMPPSIREVAIRLDKSSTTIFEHIKHLERLKAICATDIKGGSRRYRITSIGKEWLGS